MDDLLKAYDEAAQMQSIMSGTKASIARAQGSNRGFAREVRELPPLQQLQAATENVRAYGGPDKVRELALRMSTHLDNLTAMDKFVQAHGRAGLLGRMFLFTWMNGLLGSPITFTINTISNVAVPLWTTGEMWVQGAFTGNVDMMRGAVQQLMGIPEGFRQAFRMTEAGRKTAAGALREVSSATPGAVDRARVAFAQDHEEIGSAIRSFISEDSDFGGPRQFDIDERRAVTPGNMRRVVGPKLGRHFADGSMGGKLVEWFGITAGLPGRLLGTADEAAKTINYRMALRRMAWEDANGLNLKGADFDTHMHKLLLDVPGWEVNPNLTKEQRDLYSKIHEAAISQAERNTFTDPLHGMSKSAQDFASKHPASKLVLTFVRTPSNILKSWVSGPRSSPTSRTDTRKPCSPPRAVIPQRFKLLELESVSEPGCTSPP
jgi:hypothetical protein